MNPFEVARLRAQDARRVLASGGLPLTANGSQIIKAALAAWGLAIRQVSPTHPLLRQADAVIILRKGWILVRNDVNAATESFLVAHELGHFFLHRGGDPAIAVSVRALEPETDGSTAVRYVEAYGARERLELQANVFARELLLPRSLARELFEEKNLGASAIESNLEIPMELIRLQLFDAALLPTVAPHKPATLPVSPTEDQKPAVESPHKYTLVEAGPGTGKTTTLLLRLRNILGQGADPTGIVVLTFSNRAARELTERLKVLKIPNSERVWVGTFHSFGLEFLRKFGSICGLKPQVDVLDRVATFSMLEQLLPRLSLRSFDPLADPIGWLPEVLDAISRCKDELIAATTYLSEVMKHPDEDDELHAKRLDTAEIYRAYEEQLSRDQAVDLNDLLGRTVQLLGGATKAIEEYLRGISHVMVDEYQDVNRASARLVKELAKHAKTVWVVGDAHQAIYAFMGASSRNLADFASDFPGAARIALGSNHRSTQEIADTFHLVSKRGPVSPCAARLVAERGLSNRQPVLAEVDDEEDELNLLAAAVSALQPEVRVGAQAVLVFSNAAASFIAAGLERRDVPVLFLGSILERPEVRDLLCLLHLSIDARGSALGNDWSVPQWRMSSEDVTAFLSAGRADEAETKSWWDRDRSTVSPASLAAMQCLDELTRSLRAFATPWEALCSLLLESPGTLALLAGDPARPDVNSRLAIWQFVHLCRSPDGTHDPPTIRNLFPRLQRRHRLGADSHLRDVPPEAEGLDALRIMTIHKSKGLEFDAVYILDIKGKSFEYSNKREWPLIPAELFTRAAGEDERQIAKMQRHNLLYVGLSRSRTHLWVFKRRNEVLPPVLDDVGIAPDPGIGRIIGARPAARLLITSGADMTLEDLTGAKNRCPRRVEFSRRVGSVYSGRLSEQALLSVVQGRVLKRVAADEKSRETEGISTVVEGELRAAGLWESQNIHPMIRRLQEVAQAASHLFLEGGKANQLVDLHIGSSKVLVKADQVLNRSGQLILRLHRFRESAWVDATRQALGALARTHQIKTGVLFQTEIALLSDGRRLPEKRVTAPTIQAYEAAALALSEGKFAAKPGPYTCPGCPYYMLCDQDRT